MSEIATRYRKVAAQFTERAVAVPEDAWENQSPCEGWVARDVVRHLVEWMPSFFPPSAGLEFPTPPSVEDDPVGAWRAVSDTLQSALDDPDTAAREFDSRPGRFSVEAAIDMFCLSDVLIHTWDLARATGLDETLEPDEVHRMVEGINDADDEAMRASDHYGPRVEVPPDADEQTQLLAFMGREP